MSKWQSSILNQMYPFNHRTITSLIYSLNHSFSKSKSTSKIIWSPMLHISPFSLDNSLPMTPRPANSVPGNHSWRKKLQPRWQHLVVLPYQHLATACHSCVLSLVIVLRTYPYHLQYLCYTSIPILSRHLISSPADKIKVINSQELSTSQPPIYRFTCMPIHLYIPPLPSFPCASPVQGQDAVSSHLLRNCIFFLSFCHLFTGSLYL